MAIRYMIHFRQYFDPWKLAPELIYTMIIVFFCLLIYFKTKEIYDLTKYDGIKYFRFTFLFFGLAYFLRFFIHLLIIASASFDVIINRGLLMKLIIIPVSYLSTMGLFFLMLSLVWKKTNTENFIIFSNLIAIFMVMISFFTGSILIISLLQLVLLVFIAVNSLVKHKPRKKFSQIKVLYLLFSLFWLLNMYILGPMKRIPFEFAITLQVISIGVFVFIYYKVDKWLK